MHLDQVTPAEYIILKQDTRIKLHKLFNIPQTGVTETVTDATGRGIVVSDGTTYKDLEALTLDKLMTYVGGSDEKDNIHTLFVKAVNRLESEPASVETTFEHSSVTPGFIGPIPEGFKCEKCEFRSASKHGMKIHFGRNHQDYN